MTIETYTASVFALLPENLTDEGKEAINEIIIGQYNINSDVLDVAELVSDLFNL